MKPTTVFDFINTDKKEEDPQVKTPILLSCMSCHARFSKVTLEKTQGLCPNCHKNPNEKSDCSNDKQVLCLESEAEIEVWKSI